MTPITVHNIMFNFFNSTYFSCARREEQVFDSTTTNKTFYHVSVIPV